MRLEPGDLPLRLLHHRPMHHKKECSKPNKDDPMVLMFSYILTTLLWTGSECNSDGTNILIILPRRTLRSGMNTSLNVFAKFLSPCLPETRQPRSQKILLNGSEKGATS
ncbi:hypothetical protein BS47DRAFT_580525 [Hydnum rufescens UP504]|uniref:Uncharacterized protein n=1 Tax=Hydnum rufescens UP504 TaxID=1448309 RepID=A0A9P6DKB2_9AGAM|nr:hypothetical protein BS47DRAFT_580525 [Hydnum rufescens UP504]